MTETKVTHRYGRGRVWQKIMVTLYNIKGTDESQDFTLCGHWDDDLGHNFVSWGLKRLREKPGDDGLTWEPCRELTGRQKVFPGYSGDQASSDMRQASEMSR